MKIKNLIPFIIVSLYSYNKSELSISPYLEKKLGESAYNSTNENSTDYKVKTFIDSNIQKTANDALNNALITNNADYGCLVIMETKTGKVKAMANLNKDLDGNYKYNAITAVCQANEPGGLIRTYDLMALLEDKKADTSSVFDTHGGEISFFGQKMRDSHVMNGKVSLATAFSISSNSVFAQAINNSYASNPNLFCSRYKKLGLDKPLNLPFTNEATPNFPDPKSKQWSAITLPWLSIGYGFTVTPIQILTFYNAIANNGIMVKPLFLSEIKDKKGNLKTYETEVLNSKIASAKTVSSLRYLLTKKANGAGSTILTSNNITIAGNATAVPLEYADPSTKDKKYLASFAGYFPADKPKYSVVCFINNPKSQVPIYGVMVCGNAIKTIAEKVK